MIWETIVEDIGDYGNSIWRLQFSNLALWRMIDQYQDKFTEGRKMVYESSNFLELRNKNEYIFDYLYSSLLHEYYFPNDSITAVNFALLFEEMNREADETYSVGKGNRRSSLALCKLKIVNLVHNKVPIELAKLVSDYLLEKYVN